MNFNSLVIASMHGGFGGITAEQKKTLCQQCELAISQSRLVCMDPTDVLALLERKECSLNEAVVALRVERNDLECERDALKLEIRGLERRVAELEADPT